MSMNRETALKNAIMRTARFDVSIDVFSNPTQILTNLENSFYRVVLFSDDVVSIVEILNKKIISVNSCEAGEKYSIKDSSLIVSGIGGNIQIISIDYYDEFNLSITQTGISHNSVDYKESTINYYFRTSDTSPNFEKTYYTFDRTNGYSEVNPPIENFDELKVYYEKNISENDLNKHYYQPIHADDVYIKELNVSETKTNILNCNSIKLGNWTINMTKPTEVTIS